MPLLALRLVARLAARRASGRHVAVRVEWKGGTRERR